jgi:hypothetical protein
MFSGCASFRVSASWFYFSYASASISTLIPSSIGFWVSSTTGVGFTGVVSSDGISSTLTTSNDCCSPSCICTCALVLILECRAVWVNYHCFGGSIVVIFDHLLT